MNKKAKPKKKTIEIKQEKISIWGILNHGGTFLITESSIVAWLYSKDSKLANEFLKVTNGLYKKLKKAQKKQERELKEELKPLKEIIEPEEKKTEKKKWYKF